MVKAIVDFCISCPTFYQDRYFSVMEDRMRSVNLMSVRSFFLTSFAVKTVPS